jgi:tellurium resistance protein TerD
MTDVSQYRDNRESTQFHTCPVCGFERNISPNYCGQCKSNLLELSMSKGAKRNAEPNKENNDEVRCPNCKSNQITVSHKGFGVGKAAVGAVLLGPIGLIGGLAGSTDILITCLKCGQKWSPKSNR